MKNEKYGVEIEAITSQFEKKMKKLASDTQEFGKTAKQNLGFEADVDTKKVEAKLKQVMTRINELEQKSKKLDMGNGEQLEVTFSEPNVPDDKMEEYNELLKESARLQDILKEKAKDTSIDLDNVSDDLKGIANDIKQAQDIAKKQKLGMDIDTSTLDELQTKLKQIMTEMDNMKEAQKTKMLDMGGGEQLEVTFSSPQIPDDKLEKYNLLLEESRTIQNILAQKSKENADIVRNAIESEVSSQEKSVQVAQEQVSAINSEAQAVDKINVSLSDYENKTISTAKQQEYLRQKIEELKNQLASADLSFEVGDTTKIEAEIEGLENRLIKLRSTSKSTGDALKNTGTESISVFTKLKGSLTGINSHFKKLTSSVRQIGNNITKSFSQGVSKIKRFAIALLGIQSIYTGITKAVNSYLSFDTELSDSIQNNWNALGSIFAPVLEKLVSLFSTLTTYVLTFVKALTGIDLVARANAKALDKQSKSSKEASRSLSSMDEITNIQDSSSSGSSADIPQITLQEIDEAPIQKFADKFNKVITEIKDKLEFLFQPIQSAWDNYGQPVMDSVKRNFNETILLIQSIGRSFEEVWMNGTGEEMVGKILSIFERIETTIGNIKKALNTAWNNDDNGTQIIQNLADTFNSILDFVDSIGESLEKWTASESFQNALNHIVGFIKDISKYAKEIITWVVDMYKKYLAPVVDEILGFITDIINYVGTLWDEIIKPVLDPIIDILERVLEPTIAKIGITLKVIFQVFRVIVQTATKIIKDLADFWKKIFSGDFKGALKSFKKYFKDAFEGIKKIFKIVLNGIIDFANAGINGLNSMLKPVRNVIQSIAKAFGKNVSLEQISIPKIPKLKVGTPYVEEEGLAYLHKGEAVVPKKFNNKEYFGTDEQTKALLVELIQAVEENGEKVPIFNVNGKEFARATYSDFQAEGNRLNSNSYIRRLS